ncbi:MAG: trimethylamine methyltransferase family protein [Desulfobacterales bacterium]|nr:MAG: trimethylamine methyltransferase family protein [Desulfobacterales bacterium]
MVDRIKSPRLRVLDEEDARRIHRAALQILAEVGMDIQDEDTRKRLKDLGCREGDDGYLRFDEDLVQQALLTVAPRVVLYDRNGQAAIATDDGVPRFGPGIGCVNILDYKSGQHRPCRLADISQTARLCEQLSHIDLVGSLGNPSDIDPREESLETVRAIVPRTRKPLVFTVHNEIEAERVWAYLAEVAGSRQSLAAKPFAIDLTGPTSPLMLGPDACRRLRHAARNFLPVVCYPGLLLGAAGPVTLAGALAQSSAETLASIVIHQTEQPGAPVISGSGILPLDMRAAMLAYGAPEYALVCLAAADYLKDLGVPSWVGAGCSDAHTVDAQAAAEAGMNMLAAVLAGTSLIHNLGFLSAGKTGSLEMLVLCDEIAGMVSRFARGTRVTAETLAVDVTKRAGKTGLFLKDRHTVKHMRTEMWLPGLFERTFPGDWREAGSKTMNARIREKLFELLGE